MKRIVLLLALVVLAGCEDRPGATRALEGMGFKDITLYSPEVFFSGCGKGDAANNPFRAVNPSGQVVQGTVCCGGPLSFKSCTVRF